MTRNIVKLRNKAESQPNAIEKVYEHKSLETLEKPDGFWTVIIFKTLSVKPTSSGWVLYFTLKIIDIYRSSFYNK